MDIISPIISIQKKPANISNNVNPEFIFISNEMGVLNEISNYGIASLNGIGGGYRDVNVGENTIILNSFTTNATQCRFNY